jgi:enterochelin esterase-like enzyme
MTRFGQLASAAFLVAALAACGGGGDTSAGGTTTMSSIASTETGIPYDLSIWLPPGYSEGTARYPVVYAMDCEYRFATLMAVMQQASTKAILVNVCAMGSSRRLVDFTMPGAAPYYRFLTRELIPSIDAKYRTDPADRTLSGHSLSGEFAMYALYLEDPQNRYFSSIISADCSCWAAASGVFTPGTSEPARSMEQAMYDADHRLPITLVMAGDSGFNGGSVAIVYDVISARGYQDLRSVHLSYSLGHNAMDGPAFQDALKFIYSGR